MFTYLAIAAAYATGSAAAHALNKREAAVYEFDIHAGDIGRALLWPVSFASWLSMRLEHYVVIGSHKVNDLIRG